MSAIVLILTEPQDLHADRIIDPLKRRGAQVIRFHTADFPERVQLVTNIQNQTVSGNFVFDDHTVDLDTITSIWYRRPKRPRFPEWPEPVLKFAVREATAALGGLWSFLSCFWVSHPEKIAHAEFKIGQLTWARELGFTVPDTLITNDPDKVRHFRDEHAERIIYKPLTIGTFEYQPDLTGMIYTSPVENEHLAALDRVRMLPCLFQEYVPKHVEVRVTVIGETVLSVEIDSQATESTRHDWRQYDMQTPYRPHTLPAAIAAKCVALLRKLDLAFGAIDLILRPDGQYVFLEINPNGQWAWLEVLTGLPFADTLADMLVAGQPGSVLGATAD